MLSSSYQADTSSGMNINGLYSSSNSGNMMNSSSSLSSINHMTFGGAGLNMNSTGNLGGLTSTFARGTDPNSPEMFKQNVKVAMQYVELIERLAKSAGTGIEYAFRDQPVAPGQQHPSSNPIQAADDITSLRDCLDAFAEFLADTGVGALPLPSTSTATVVSPSGVVDEEKLMKMTTERVEKLYSMQRQIQENNGVAGNLLVTAGASVETGAGGLTAKPSRESMRR